MTGSQTRTYMVRGAEVTITASVYPATVEIAITVDLTALDQNEPDHSAHQLIEYLQLPNYSRGQTHWWAKTHRRVVVRTGSQAQRVVKHALAKIDDAIHEALIARDARKAHLATVFVAD